MDGLVASWTFPEDENGGEEAICDVYSTIIGVSASGMARWSQNDRLSERMLCARVIRSKPRSSLANPSRRMGGAVHSMTQASPASRQQKMGTRRISGLGLSGSNPYRTRTQTSVRSHKGYGTRW